MQPAGLAASECRYFFCGCGVCCGGGAGELALELVIEAVKAETAVRMAKISTTTSERNRLPSCDASRSAVNAARTGVLHFSQTLSIVPSSSGWIENRVVRNRTTGVGVNFSVTAAPQPYDREAPQAEQGEG